MRRAPIVIGGTIVGLGGVLGFPVQPRRPAHLVPVATASSSPAVKTGSAQRRSTTGTATGADVPNQCGDVQVRVSVTGNRITKVTPVALPGNDPRSQEISAVAAPQLAQEAFAAQSVSANVDASAPCTRSTCPGSRLPCARRMWGVMCSTTA